MSKSLRLFFIIIFLGLPLWWGINVFAQKLEDFFYTNVAAQEEEVFNQKRRDRKGSFPKKHSGEITHSKHHKINDRFACYAEL